MAKRKRRSFWEPDNEKIVAWLNAQSDLGKSLQVIVADAVKQYGEGDVVQSYLNQQFESDGLGPAPQTKPAPKQKTEKREAAPPKTAPEQMRETQKEQPPKQAEAPEKPEQVSEETPVGEAQPKAPAEAPPSAPVEAPVPAETAEDEVDIGDDYNPIDVMFADLNSRQR